MYVHPAFKPDERAMEALLAARGFGTLVAHDGTGPLAVHAPFLFARSGGPATIALHVARANPIHEAVARDPRVLVACLGADAYISPDWYASANQVPTWNYVAVHAMGRARLMAAGELLAHVDRLSGLFEERLPKKPWTSDKMDPQRRAAMLNAIVGILVEVERLEGQWKLGQHKSRVDHDGAVAGLRALGDPGAAALAELMEAARRP
jgi:transcriptional regulator